MMIKVEEAYLMDLLTMKKDALTQQT